MKKLLMILLPVLLLAILVAIPVIATPDAGVAGVGDATGKPGETVDIYVNLSNLPEVHSVAVTCDVPSGLKMESGKWLLSGGTITNVNTSKKQAVWTAEEPVNISEVTDVLRLSFKILDLVPGQEDFDYEIGITVIIQDDEGKKTLEPVTSTVKVSQPATALELSKNQLTLDLNGGVNADLVATLTPAVSTDKVVWTSSDSSVVTVENGKLTAVKRGQATIAATAGAVSDSCVVTVVCGHKLTEYPATPASCQGTGNNLYYVCNICGDVLAADKSSLTTVEAQTLPKVSCSGGTPSCSAQAVCSMCGQPYGEKLPHEYQTVWSTDESNHWHQCRNCEDKIDLASHKFQWIIDSAATEDVTGLKHEECDCGYKRNEGTVIDKLDHVHVGITNHPAVPATCVATGTVEYWTCSSSKCAGKYYGDAACQTVLTTIVAGIDSTNHVGGTTLKGAFAATCGAAGYSGDTHCASCDALLKQGAEIPATGNHTAKAGWITSDTQHWQECSVCDAVIGEKQTHALTWIQDQAPTEENEGVKHQVCEICDYECNKGTAIDKLAHEPELMAGSPATCTEAGVMEHFYCDNCGKYFASVDGQVGDEITQADTVIGKLDHTFGTEWTSDKDGHWYACVCGEKADLSAHTPIVVGKVDPAEGKPGYTGDTVCEICGHIIEEGKTVTNPATGADMTVFWLMIPVVASTAALIYVIWNKKRRSV